MKKYIAITLLAVLLIFSSQTVFGASTSYPSTTLTPAQTALKAQLLQALTSLISQLKALIAQKGLTMKLPDLSALGIDVNSIPAANLTSTSAYSFKKDLTPGVIDPDVKELQKFLNTHNYIIANSGTGAPGYENKKFGPATQAALIKFQKANYITPANGFFGASTRAVIAKINISSPSASLPTSSMGAMNMSSMASSGGGGSSGSGSYSGGGGGGGGGSSGGNSSYSYSSSQSSSGSGGGGGSVGSAVVDQVVINNPAPAPTTNLHTATKSGVWSDATLWNNGAVPDDGANVTIPSGVTVTLDTDTTSLGSITINGILVVDRKNISITAGYIMVSGSGAQFIAGTESSPFTNNLIITLNGDRNLTATSMGGRVFGAMMGGKIDLIGKAPLVNWTMLNATASAGASSITLDQTVDWKAGDEIIITSTDYDSSQTEKKTIASVSGTTITLTSPLQNKHFGQIETFEHNLSGVPHTIDERAEVGLLTHNIVVQGAADSETDGFGGHIMIMDTASVGHFQGVELYRMGQMGVKGRYPLHWHNVNDGGSNSYAKGNSVYHSFSRCYTVHKTNNIKLEDNVGYDTFGHCYFIEDGKEIRNTYTHNLGALIKLPPVDKRLLASDSNPAVFWTANPNNDFINNAAAGTEQRGNGFWFDAPLHPAHGTISEDDSYFPQQQPFGIFKGNRVHSIVPNTLPTEEADNGGWGLALPISGFYANHDFLSEDLTMFKVGLSFFSGALTSKAVLKNSSIASDFIIWKGYDQLVDSLLVADRKLANNPGPVSTVPAIWSYDGHGDAINSVLIGYKGVFFNTGHTFASSGGWCSHCQFIDSNITYPLARQTHGVLPDLQNFTLMIPDPDDSFGNGAPGAFVNQPYQIDSTCKNASQGAKRLSSDDNETYWCPRNYGLITLGDSGQFSIRPDDQTEFTPLPGANKNQVYVMTNRLYHLKSISNINALSVDVGNGGNYPYGMVGPANVPGDFAIFSLTTTQPVVSVGISSPNVPQASSLSNFLSTNSEGWFYEASTSMVYLKAPVVSVIRIGIGYQGQSASAGGNQNKFSSIANALSAIIDLFKQLFPAK